MDANIAKLLNSSEEDREKGIDLLLDYCDNNGEESDVDRDSDSDLELDIWKPPDSDEEGTRPTACSDSECPSMEGCESPSDEKNSNYDLLMKQATEFR